MEKERKDDEIKVTPEMIEAGMKEYSARWVDLCDADEEAAKEMLIAAYRVMTALVRER